jgi:hypothetical protein
VGAPEVQLVGQRTPWTVTASEASRTERLPARLLRVILMGRG